jgi:hypothetical protein
VKTLESSRMRVWAGILSIMGIYIGAVYWVYRLSVSATESPIRLLPLASSMALVPGVLVVALGIYSLIAKSVRYAAWGRDARVSPEIRDCLANVTFGEGDRQRLFWLAQHHRRAFEVIFTEFLSSFGGTAKSELGALAVEFGLAERWRRETRSPNFLRQKTALANLGRIRHAIDPHLLEHPLEQTRIEAACAFLASGSADAPIMVFEMLPKQSLLGRIRLADSLRPFATEICDRYLSKGMQSADVQRARASVDLLSAWERWLPIEGFSRLLAEGDTELRLAALPALRYVSVNNQESAEEIFDLLESSDERVHASAAKAASDMGMSASIPLLVNQLRRDGPVSALAAARALAGLGSEGRDLLENEIYSSARPQYALQALEQSLVAERV